VLESVETRRTDRFRSVSTDTADHIEEQVHRHGRGLHRRPATLRQRRLRVYIVGRVAAPVDHIGREADRRRSGTAVGRSGGQPGERPLRGLCPTRDERVVVAGDLAPDTHTTAALIHIPYTIDRHLY